MRLLVEDDPSMIDLLRRALGREAYAVDVVSTGDEALWAAGEHPYDGVVLDAMIPAPDGFEVARRLRAGGNGVPILMLTARDAIGDRVAGLDAGADDYLTKPFAIAELFARFACSGAPGTDAGLTEAGGGGPRPRSVHPRGVAGRPASSPDAEGLRALLEYLMRRPGKVVSRTELMEHVWDFAYEGSSNVVDAYVSRVREAVDRSFDDPLIETVRGVGYRLRQPTSP